MTIYYTVYYASHHTRCVYRGQEFTSYAAAQGMFEILRVTNGGTENLYLVERNSTIEKKFLQDHKTYELIIL